MKSTQLTLVNSKNGNLALKVMAFDEDTFDHVQRLDHYSIIWLKKGRAKLCADFSEYMLSRESLMFFFPYQPFMLSTEDGFSGVAIHFHSEFFCIYKHDKETSCNGLLFNNIFDPPFIFIEGKTDQCEFQLLLERIKDEMYNGGLSQQDMLVSYLKIFLINATRIKKTQDGMLKKSSSKPRDNRPLVLQNLKKLLEENYRSKRAPSDYAAMLHMSPKTLGKIAKDHFNKTLTQIISERVVIEAKRELYLTEKTVKQISSELGFRDEYYFSRYFKNQAGVSPIMFRENVGGFRYQV